MVVKAADGCAVRRTRANCQCTMHMLPVIAVTTVGVRSLRVMTCYGTTCVLDLCQHQQIESM